MSVANFGIFCSTKGCQGKDAERKAPNFLGYQGGGNIGKKASCIPDGRRSSSNVQRKKGSRGNPAGEGITTSPQMIPIRGTKFPAREKKRISENESENSSLPAGEIIQKKGRKNSFRATEIGCSPKGSWSLEVERCNRKMEWILDIRERLHLQRKENLTKYLNKAATKFMQALKSMKKPAGGRR